MDHLLRNRRLGSLAATVSTLFIDATVYFLHRSVRLPPHTSTTTFHVELGDFSGTSENPICDHPY